MQVYWKALDGSRLRGKLNCSAQLQPIPQGAVGLRWFFKAALTGDKGLFTDTRQTQAGPGQEAGGRSRVLGEPGQVPEQSSAMSHLGGQGVSPVLKQWF